MYCDGRLLLLIKGRRDHPFGYCIGCSTTLNSYPSAVEVRCRLRMKSRTADWA